ncbi:rhodanese-like domain-containing protein [Patescibacteria group bacterium]|nr:rhodanese-like domain-containing protein [Patescibacteria group bacterium]MBU1922264.1 rhodanese-like domain-containing protein [Patescibacteria group bacterium]
MTSEISLEELKQKIDKAEKFYLIDVRTREQYEHNHIAEALGLAWGSDFEKQVTHILPDKDAEIIVYGANESCERAKKAAEFLQSHGYAKVRIFSLGILGWMEAGLRLEFGRES